MSGFDVRIRVGISLMIEVLALNAESGEIIMEVRQKLVYGICVFFGLLNCTAGVSQATDLFIYSSKLWEKVEEPVHYEEHYFEVEHLFNDKMFLDIFKGHVVNVTDFHIVDYNNDGHWDIAYDGLLNPSDGRQLIFFRGVCQDWCGYYKLDKHLFGELEYVKLNSGNQFEFKVTDNPDCDRNSVIEETFVIKNKLEECVFQLVDKTARLVWTKVPSENGRTGKFEVQNEHYKLRTHPVFEDRSVESPFVQNVLGNVIAEYPKGSTGVFLAEKKDVIGRLWFYVLMDNNLKPESDLVNQGRNSQQQAKYYGWMSAKYLKY